MPAENIGAAERAILAKIEELAAAIPSDADSGFDIQAARCFALAVNQLAEARAWLRAPAESHGGSVIEAANS